MAIEPEIRELERVNLTCPLGVRFWDRLTEGFIGDGLRVGAWPVGHPEQVRWARMNRRNGFVFQGLPGLREIEFGAGDDAFWASPPVHREFVVRADDAQRRFLPVSLRVMLPHEGWLRMPCEASPAGRPSDSVPLFSSPARPLAAGVAMVRADLWDPTRGAPAAWAVLEARAVTPTGSALVRGLADRDGRVLVVFGYPELPPPQSASPPGGGLGLAGQTWDLELSVRYRALVSEPSPPDLCAILGQPPGVLLDRVSPEATLTGGQLSFGQLLALRSSGDGRGRLLVRPA